MSLTVGFRMDKGHWRNSVLSAFVEDRERVNDTDDGLTVLAEWGTRNFFDMQWNRVGIYKIADRALRQGKLPTVMQGTPSESGILHWR